MTGEVECDHTPSLGNALAVSDVAPDLGARGVAVNEEKGWRIVFEGGVGCADEAVVGVEGEAAAGHSEITRPAESSFDRFAYRPVKLTPCSVEEKKTAVDRGSVEVSRV